MTSVVKAYNCDITYVTNNELGFDYLRDNMVIYKEQLVIDEVDSVSMRSIPIDRRGRVHHLSFPDRAVNPPVFMRHDDILAQQMKRGEDVPEYSKMECHHGIEQEETGDFCQ